MIEVLRKYEEQSKQLINKEKSSFYLYSKAIIVSKQLVEETTGFRKEAFP